MFTGLILTPNVNARSSRLNIKCEVKISVWECHSPCIHAWGFLIYLFVCEIQFPGIERVVPISIIFARNFVRLLFTVFICTFQKNHSHLSRIGQLIHRSQGTVFVSNGRSFCFLVYLSSFSIAFICFSVNEKVASVYFSYLLFVALTKNVQ